LSDGLLSQDKLLKRVARERKEYKDKLEQALKDLELARSSMTVTEETECDEFKQSDTCAIHMSSLVTLQNKYGTLLDEHDELKARSILLGACKSYSGLQSELAEKNDKISALEKASSDSTAVARCALCESLELELESCRHDKMRSKEENTYLRTILSWVSCSEPKLGLMVNQFRRGTGGLSVDFALGGKGENLYGKVGEHSGLKPCEKPTTTPQLIKISPREPKLPTTKDGVFEGPLKPPPQKQVWVQKPNHLKNPLDTLPNIS